MFILFFAVIVFFTTPICKSIPENSETIEQMIYAGVNYNDLFDQSRVLEKNKHITDETTLNALLIKKFKQNKKYGMYRAYRQPIIGIALPLGITCGLLRLTDNKEASALLQFTLIAYAANAIQQLFRIGAYFISSPQNPLDAYEQKYVAQKRFLSPTLQQAIQNKLASGRKSATNIDTLLTYLQIALNLPRTNNPSCMPQKKEVVALQKQYEPALDSILEVKLFNHYYRSSTRSSATMSPKTVLYFQGPTGCGKTYTAHQCANLLKLPLVEIKASEHAQDIIGTETTPGSFLEAITQVGIPHNAIIFIDEADRIFNGNNTSLQAFLQLLEPHTTHFYSPYLREKIDISGFCFILAGNTPIVDSALRSRLTTITFGALSSTYKEQLIHEIVQQEIVARQQYRSLTHNDASLAAELEELKHQPLCPRSLHIAISDCINRYAIA